MRDFAALCETLLCNSEEAARRQALASYFAAAPASHAQCALTLLRGPHRRLLSPAAFHALALAESALPEWLFEQARAASGDLAETAAVLLGRHEPGEQLPLPVWQERLAALRQQEPAVRATQVRAWWQTLTITEQWILNKLLLGQMRLKISDVLLAEALHAATGCPVPVMVHRLARKYSDFGALTALDDSDCMRALPWPFATYEPADRTNDFANTARAWHAEPSHGGLRVQLVRRDGCAVWSERGELLAAKLPDLVAASHRLPANCVLEGELVQRSSGRFVPVVAPDPRTATLLVIWDVLALGGDLRDAPLTQRLAERRKCVDDEFFFCATELAWPDSSTAAHGQLLLRRRAAPYGSGHAWQGRRHRIHAALLYAETGLDGRYSVLSLGVADRGRWLPVAKLASNLPEEEAAALDEWIRGNTLERFGPVRAVAPQRMFQLEFTAVLPSRRHKAGLRLEGTDIRGTGTAEQPATLADLQALLP